MGKEIEKKTCFINTIYKSHINEICESKIYDKMVTTNPILSILFGGDTGG